MHIVGGGPAGACCAMRLAEWGRRVALEHHAHDAPTLPQETLVDSARPLLEAWGLLELVATRWPGTPRHAVIWGDDTVRWRVGIDASPGYKVVRKELDHLLRARAATAGVELVPSADAEITAVATGKTAPPGRAGTVTVRALPKTVALFGLVDTADSWTDTTVIEAVPEGWWWWLPLGDGVASLALIADASDTRVRGSETVVASAREAAQGPARMLAPAEWHGMNATPRLRTSRQGHVLVGDAASTIDPLSSQGVEKALASAEEAAYAVNTMLACPDDREAVLEHHASWERDLFEAHARRALDFYGRERRFPDATFWKTRHAALDSEAAPQDDELPERLAPAPDLVSRTAWRRGDRVLVPEPGWTVGDAAPLARVADVAIGTLIELLGDGASIDDVIRGAASRPELFLSTPKRVEGALRQLYRRGFLAGV